MLEEDNLYAKNLKNQCESMIRQLQKNNEALDDCKQTIQAFVSNESLQSNSYTAAKRHMERYLYVITALQIANNYDIKDNLTLKHLCGKENLIGSKIIPYIRELESKLVGYEAERAHCNSQCIANADNILCAFYNLLLYGIEHDIKKTEELLEEWRAKSIKFDEIADMTSPLFSGVGTFRAAAKSALADLANVFVENGNYPLHYSDAWKTKLDNAVEEYELTRTVFLTNKSAVTIIDEDGNKYCGGNKNWFRDGTKEGDVFGDNAGGFISAMDFHYKMEGIAEVTKKEYMDNTMKEFKSNKLIYNQIVNWEHGVVTDIPFIPGDMKGLMEKDVKNAGYDKVTWNRLSKYSIESIKTQIQQDIPVIFNVKDTSSNPKKKLGLYTSPKDLDTHFDSLFVGENIYMTITGVQDTIDLNTGNTQTMLAVIANFGEKFYIKYDDLVQLETEFSKVHIK